MPASKAYICERKFCHTVIAMSHNKILVKRHPTIRGGGRAGGHEYTQTQGGGGSRLSPGGDLNTLLYFISHPF